MALGRGCLPYAEVMTTRIPRDPTFIRARSVVSPSGCWDWSMTVHKRTGYGSTTRPTSRVPVSAHVLSYEVFHGPVPAGLHVDHTCSNRRCVNPDHLEAVTPAENNRRISERGRSRNQNTGKDACPECGGPYVTMYRPARPKGFRRCVPCHRAHQNEYERAQRATKRGG